MTTSVLLVAATEAAVIPTAVTVATATPTPTYKYVWALWAAIVCTAAAPSALPALLSLMAFKSGSLSEGRGLGRCMVFLLSYPLR
jgi:hypothetical protein